MEAIGTYKDRAIASLTGKWGASAITILVYFIISSAASAALAYGIHEQMGNVATILLLPLGWGVTVYFLRLSRSENVDLGMIFDGFKDYIRIFLTELLVGIYTILWMLLLIVPGIIKSYSYAMTSFLLKDNAKLKYDQAIEESMRLMDGHKMDLFLLDLSFIGWFLLSCLTLGIGFLFLLPYWYTARAYFYQDLVAGNTDYQEY